MVRKEKGQTVKLAFPEGKIPNTTDDPVSMAWWVYRHTLLQTVVHDDVEVAFRAGYEVGRQDDGGPKAVRAAYYDGYDDGYEKGFEEGQEEGKDF